jgi:arylsulfatase A-like enzyme
VNPHTPYTPRAPFDKKFLDGSERRSPRLSVVPSFHGGLPKQWAHPGQDRLGYYVAQYDGEIATVDQEIGRLFSALREQGLLEKTVVVLTSDHGESLGEHDYYFDHGENLFDPSLAIPLMVLVPRGPAGRRSQAFASTLDLLPTILDAVKVSYPPELAGQSLLAEVTSGGAPARDRLFAQNDRNLTATFDRSYKLVATPRNEGGADLALFDRKADPREVRDMARARPDILRAQRRELEMYQERGDREWGHTRTLVQGKPREGKMTPDACERLRALGYTGVPECGF